jgi:hypothetical protein
LGWLAPPPFRKGGAFPWRPMALPHGFHHEAGELQVESRKWFNGAVQTRHTPMEADSYESDSNSGAHHGVGAHSDAGGSRCEGQAREGVMDDAGAHGPHGDEVYPEVDLDEESLSDQRPDELAHCGLRQSQARLIIPRTISEYFECCRYSRCHSEGLLLAASQPSGALVNARRLVPRVLSEGLLAGRLIMMASNVRRGGAEGDAGSADQATPPPRFPAEDLEQGLLLEGRIIRIANVGLYIDVGATLPGLLRRRDCSGVPRRLLRRGEVLSNLVVLQVANKRHFRVGLQTIGEDDQNFQDFAYLDCLRRICAWAGVPLPADADGEPAASSTGDVDQGGGRLPGQHGLVDSPSGDRGGRAPPEAAAPPGAEAASRTGRRSRRRPRQDGSRGGKGARWRPR